MSLSDRMFWWVGALTIAVLCVPAVMFVLDWAVTYTVRVVWTQREFLMFVADRLKKRRKGND